MVPAGRLDKLHSTQGKSDLTAREHFRLITFEVPETAIRIALMLDPLEQFYAIGRLVLIIEAEKNEWHVK